MQEVKRLRRRSTGIAGQTKGATRGILILSTVLAVLAGCQAPRDSTSEEFTIAKEIQPYTHSRFLNDPDNFQFAIVGDRAGGVRLGVFAAAIDRLNLLQPEFVMSVGDLIEGYTEDEERLRDEWAEIDGMVNSLEMPFFYVVGNHDMGNEVMRQMWRDRMGGQDYYHFIYKDVLFIIMNTEDPPLLVPDELKERYYALKELEKTDPERAARDGKAVHEELVKSMPTAIGDVQTEYIREALEANTSVRWTMIFMHKPAWEEGSGHANFDKIEAMVADRPYTMFAGHKHNYAYTNRLGRDYIRMGAAGGSWEYKGPGNIDHVTWVTMTDDGPIFSNLLLSGILDKHGAPESASYLEFDPSGEGANE